VRDDERGELELSDAELVRRARSGEEKAQGLLVRRHQDGVFRLALSYLRERDPAEDVVQEVFVKAFRALGRFRGDAEFRTWLFRIAVNESKSALRRTGRRSETALDDAGDVATESLDPAERAVVRDEAARARSALNVLPEKQRLSVALRTEEGLSFKEIGEITGSSEGAARVNYFHGIRRLREIMQ
jgi:RNA polymerase sigma-70 factor (ECF subfamily)